MASYRLIITLGLAMLTAMALLPASSRAGSLLSGYGGPGEGNQAILGAALLNGPRGGGGGSGGSGSTAGAGAASSTAQGSVAGSVRGGHPSRPARSPRQLERTGANASTRGASAEPAADLTASRERAGRSSAPVLSGADLAYIFVALAALVLTGLLTRRMTQHPGNRAGG
jgi:hypothetical protein